MLWFGFDPETNVFRFCCVFWYHCNLLIDRTKKNEKTVQGREGTKRCPVLYGYEI